MEQEDWCFKEDNAGKEALLFNRYQLRGHTGKALPYNLFIDKAWFRDLHKSKHLKTKKK